MSAGSGASNLGYGNIYPFSNVNGQYANVYSTNNPANFGSNEIPGLPGLAGAKSNIDAAAGKVPGICLFKGGSKGLKRKIKNITKKYKKMKAGSRKMKSLKKKLRTRMASRSLARRFAGGKRRTKTRRHRAQRGGYSQYQNNLPMTPTYQVAGINLPSSQLGLANPPPIRVLPNCVNCVDNLNAYSMRGFPSKGH
jgi:hypothetical protein